MYCYQLPSTVWLLLSKLESAFPPLEIGFTLLLVIVVRGSSKHMPRMASDAYVTSRDFPLLNSNLLSNLMIESLCVLAKARFSLPFCMLFLLHPYVHSSLIIFSGSNDCLCNSRNI